jgi:hypothetical protein
VIDEQLDCKGRSLHEIYSRVDKAFAKRGLVRTYLPLAGGFVGVTPPHKIDNAGEPLCRPGDACEEFATDFVTQKGFWQRIQGIFYIEPVQYRVLAIFVAPDISGLFDKADGPTIVDVSRDGLPTLPPDVVAGKNDSARPVRCHGALWMYRRETSSSPAVKISGNITVLQHLGIAP